MKSIDTIYRVRRIYGKHDRDPRNSISWNEDGHTYGWTDSKSILRLFMLQRSKTKYVYEKLDPGDFEQRTKMILVEVPSRQLRKKVTFVTTSEEWEAIKIRIHNMFKETSSFSGGKTGKHISVLVKMILNLNREYAIALSCIGYEPDELSQLYDGPADWYSYDPNPLGYSMKIDTHDMSRYVVNTIESVVMVASTDL